MLDITRVELNFHTNWGRSVTESYTGRVFGKEGAVQTANLRFGPKGYGVDVTREISPGVRLGVGSDGLGEGFALSLGFFNSTYSAGVSTEGFTYGSYITSGDRVTGHVTTYTPTPLTGLIGVLGGVTTYILNHPMEILEKSMQVEL